MKQCYPFVLGALLCFTWRAELSAQCNSAPCVQPFPSVNAQDACVLANPDMLDCYYGETTSDAPESIPATWCGDNTIDNNKWFAFTATSTNASFQITTHQCSQGNGVQAAIFSSSNCVDFQLVSNCLGNVPQFSAATTFANNLTPGQVYYLCIDGSNGALCEFTINELDFNIGTTIGNHCLPAPPQVFTSNDITSWSIDPPSAGNFIGSSIGDTVRIEWVEPGIAQVCGQSLTCSNSPPLCFTITNGEAVFSQEEFTICQGESATCGGMTKTTNSNYTVTLPSYLDCDSTVTCIIHVVPTIMTTENVRMCQGGSVTCAGEEFFSPGTYPVTLDNYQGCDSTVKCVVTIIPISVSPVKFVNLCGPAQYEVCGEAFTETGVYTKTCTGWLGCDSIVNIDLAILKPKAVIAPPAVLDCSPGAIVTISGAGSPANAATGGDTRYKWSGPGILGPDDQVTVQVTQPGTYCLILQHSRGGVVCADTACVTVLQNAATPLLSGVQNPCAGQTLMYTATAAGNAQPSGFIWTLPGGQPFSVVTPNTIEVTWAAASLPGQLCVAAQYTCGNSIPACLPVVLTPQPIAPSISGPGVVCTGDGPQLFSLDTLQAGTEYVWSVPAGAVLTGSGDSVQVHFASAGSGQVCVVAQNGCDTLAPVCKEVLVVSNPTGYLSAPAAICNGDITELTFTLTGSGPFDVLWSVGIDTMILSNINTGHQLQINPAQNTTYTLLSVTDKTAAACASTVPDSVTIIVWPKANSTQTLEICAGQSVFLGGAAQQLPGVYYDTLSTVHGCDSVLVTTLLVNSIDTTHIGLTTCDAAAAGVSVVVWSQTNGCDSVVITTTTLLPSDTTTIFKRSCDLADVGIFTQNLSNQWGCDSTVVTTVTFANADTTLLSTSTCDPAGEGVFSELLVGSDGCDSLVITTVNLLPSTTIFLDLYTCNPAEAGETTTVFTNQYGCDSTIIRTILFAPLPPILLNTTTCNPADAGVFTDSLQTSGGCDSVIVTTVTFVPLPVTQLAVTTCDPNSAGVFTQNLQTAAGCDSTVVTTVTLLPSQTTTLFGQSCNPAEVGVFTQNLSGQNGCDSTVVTTITFNGIPPTQLNATTCDPGGAGVFTQHITTAGGCDSMVVTTVSLLPSSVTNLSAQDCNPTNVGVFTQDLSNQFGCDSMVITTVSLLPSHQIFLETTTCLAAEAGVFVFPLVNQFGCDSIVTQTVTLQAADTTLLTFGTCDPTQTGTVVTHWSNQFGCDSMVVAVTSLLPAASCGMTATLSGSTIPCGQNTGSLTLIATLGEGPFDYSVLSGGNVLTTGSIAAVNVPTLVNGLPAGNYTVVYSSANGFSATAQANITQLTPPQLNVSTLSNYNGFGVSCPGASDGQVQAGFTGGLSPFGFSWSNGAGTALVNDLGAGVYTVTVTDANQCTNIASLTLSEPDPLEITFVVNNPTCFGNNTGAITVAASGGAPPYRFAVNGGNAQSSNLFPNLSAGSYTLTAYDANDCETSEIIAINTPVPLNVDLGDDQYIELGSSVALQAIVNVPFDSLASVIWTPLPDSAECPQCLTQSIIPLISTTYAIQVVDNNGCSDEDKVVVIVDRQKHVYVPNVFSPDGDGQNDKFSLFARPGSVRNVRSFAVYDRWGDAVFQVKDFSPYDHSIGWDGTYKGQPMTPAVFVWVAEIEFIDGYTEIFKGDVTLVR